MNYTLVIQLLSLVDKQKQIALTRSRDWKTKHKDDLVKLLRQKKDLEENIIDKIISNEYDLDKVYSTLEKESHVFFLDTSRDISAFKFKKSIIGSTSEDSEHQKKIKEFKDLCLSFWEDGLITDSERKALDLFCRNNQISPRERDLIESEVRRATNKFHLESLVAHYHLNEGMNTDEILEVFATNYNLNVPREKVLEEINQLDIGNLSKVGALYEESGIIVLKLKFKHNKEVHLRCVEYKPDTHLKFSSFYDRSILTITISIDFYKSLAKEDVVDIITDALCFEWYNTTVELIKNRSSIKKMIKKQVDLNLQ